MKMCGNSPTSKKWWQIKGGLAVVRVGREKVLKLLFRFDLFFQLYFSAWVSSSTTWSPWLILRFLVGSSESEEVRAPPQKNSELLGRASAKSNR